MFNNFRFPTVNLTIWRVTPANVSQHQYQWLAHPGSDVGFTDTVLNTLWQRELITHNQARPFILSYDHQMRQPVFDMSWDMQQVGAMMCRGVIHFSRQWMHPTLIRLVISLRPWHSNISCKFWRFWIYAHWGLKWPNHNQLKQNQFFLTTAMFCSVDNDLNFLLAHKGCLLPLHNIQEVPTVGV